MSELRFEWDPRKAVSNSAKHGVTFDEATTVFSDELALFMDDPEHSDDEDRFVLMGLSSSARRANSRERRQYRESNSP